MPEQQWPSCIRFSTVVRRLRSEDIGPDDGSPFVIFACPWCSGEGVREAWEREGEIAHEIFVDAEPPKS